MSHLTQLANHVNQDAQHTKALETLHAEHAAAVKALEAQTKQKEEALAAQFKKNERDAEYKDIIDRLCDAARTISVIMRKKLMYNHHERFISSQGLGWINLIGHVSYPSRSGYQKKLTHVEEVPSSKKFEVTFEVTKADGTTEERKFLIPKALFTASDRDVASRTRASIYEFKKNRKEDSLLAQQKLIKDADAAIKLEVKRAAERRKVSVETLNTLESDVEKENKKMDRWLTKRGGKAPKLL